MNRTSLLFSVALGSLTLGGCDEPSVSDNVLPDAEFHACNMDITPGLNRMTCDGIDFAVQMPEQCVDDSCPVIIDLHGHGVDADTYERDSRLRQLGSERGRKVGQRATLHADPLADHARQDKTATRIAFLADLRNYRWILLFPPRAVAIPRTVGPR